MKSINNSGLVFLTPVFGILAAALSTVITAEIPLLHSYVLITIIGLIVTSAIGGLAIALLWRTIRSGNRSPWVWAYALAQAIYWYLVIDLSYGWHSILTKPLDLGFVNLATIGSSGRVILMLVFLAVVTAIFVGARFAAQTLTTIFSFVLFVLVLASATPTTWSNDYSIGLPSTPSAEVNTAGNVRVLIIMDEMMGVEGIDTTTPEGQQLVARIDDLWREKGFRVYGQAFSRYYWSNPSIPAMLNFNRSTSEPQSDTGDIAESAFFDMASAAGSAVSVYQTSHFNFCESSVVETCKVYPSFNPLNPFIENTYSILEFLSFLANHRFAESYAAVYGAKLTGLSNFEMPYRFEPPGFPGWFDSFANDLRAGRTEPTVLAHFLAPHAPYDLTSDCGRNTGSNHSGYDLTEALNLEGEELEQAITDINAIYLGQYACVLEKVFELADMLSATPSLRDATIVITGDHGSRISKGHNIESLDRRDLINNHSAFFAVRSPGVTPQYDDRFVAVQDLVGTYFGDLPIPSGSSMEEVIFVNSNNAEGLTVSHITPFADFYPDEAR